MTLLVFKIRKDSCCIHQELPDFHEIQVGNTSKVMYSLKSQIREHNLILTVVSDTARNRAYDSSEPSLVLDTQSHLCIPAFTLTKNSLICKNFYEIEKNTFLLSSVLPYNKQQKSSVQQYGAFITKMIRD